MFEVAQQNRTNLYYEASVAGGIPIIKVLREGLIGNRITRLYGIINGTCNYILTRMKLEGADFDDVLAVAQRLGYAEAEPSLDIDGHDAAHKIGKAIAGSSGAHSQDAVRDFHLHRIALFQLDFIGNGFWDAESEAVAPLLNGRIHCVSTLNLHVAGVKR